MTALLDLRLQAAGRLSAYVIDARLALAPGGLVFAIELARFAPVWLTQKLWELIDSAYFYRTYPEQLVVDEADDGARNGVVDALWQWHAAWLSGTLNGAFFWIGDERRESALPAHASVELSARYSRLRTAFDAGDDTANPFAACGKAAFALAAALTGDAPTILTLARAKGGGAPLICGEFAGHQRHGLKITRSKARWLDELFPGRLRLLIAQLAELNTRIAAVHMFAPSAIALPPGAASEESGVPDVPTDIRCERSPWDDAHVFWHELS